MAEAKETGINGFHFNSIGIFFFDFPGQSTEIGSPLSSGPVGVDRYSNHNNYLLFSNYYVLGDP
jgi:hypothetical protein